MNKHVDTMVKFHFSPHYGDESIQAGDIVKIERYRGSRIWVGEGQSDNTFVIVAVDGEFYSMSITYSENASKFPRLHRYEAILTHCRKAIDAAIGVII